MPHAEIYHHRTLRLPENCPPVHPPAPVKDADLLLVLKQLVDQARITNRYLSIMTNEEILVHELGDL